MSENMDLDPKDFADSVIRIIQKELPTIAKFNMHLYQNILSAIELTMDQSVPCDNPVEYSRQNRAMSEETKKEVDKIIAELNL